MDSRAIQGLSPAQQHQFMRLAPEARNAFLLHIRKQNQKHSGSFHQSVQQVHNTPTINISPPLATMHEEPKPPKRRRGGGPRKCNNPSCDRIVTKRNFCYKCQKRKERGLPMGPRLPPVSHVLQQTQVQTPESKPQLPPLNFMNSPLDVKPSMTTLQTLTQQQNAKPKAESDDVGKMAQLHNYLLGLAGSEEKANELIQGYLSQKASSGQTSASSTPNGHFVQQTQTPDQSFTRFY